MPERTSVSISTVALKIPAESPAPSVTPAMLVRITVAITPEVTMTGRKKMARMTPRPRNFCPRTMATNRLNSRITGIW